MTVTMFKGKLHRLTVTEADLYYEGSITLDRELMEAARLLPYERVQVLNVNAGTRLETYTIPAPPGSRTVCLNGPAARLVAPGDQVIVIAYADMTPDEAAAHRPRVVLVDADNNPTEILDLDGSDVADPSEPAVTNAIDADGLWSPRLGRTVSTRGAVRRS
ncbi:aspartate 1-decarboxylase [Rubrivirga sp. S365]|uniref:Aspartate 1-decarboxylase n=1 Tax=Rubrivirga litoralis TaxID=3075598 RepID=A0ABU3BPP9_9BACT|nr:MULTISPECIES: aspartate 1-decarboxylase [unclassified Rubrivirga]MDT0631235.1 aspartate 1-decarboxylase [Rubrivirga sp. F394]MDT7856622.1 aspartate 1-decarboxylase [Rubrivirga sp. S365]